MGGVLIALLAIIAAGISACSGGGGNGSAATAASPTLRSITIDPIAPTIANSTTVQLTATGHFSDNSVKNLTSSVQWSSDDDLTASVSNDATSKGLVSGLSVSSATITAKRGKIFGTSLVTVTSTTLNPIGGITISPANPSIAQGTTVQLTATGHFQDGSAQDLTTASTWSSSDNINVPVSDAAGTKGLVTGAGPSTAMITADDAGITGSTTATVTVTSATLQSITVDPVNPSIAKGLTVQLTATGHFSDNTTQNITTLVNWTTADPATAQVSNVAGSQGLVTGKGVSTATITATLSGQSGSTDVSVTPAVLRSINVAPSDSTIAKGTTVQLSATGNLSDGTTEDLTGTAAWGSSDETIAHLSNAAGSQGLVTGTGVGGPVTITATSGVISGTATVTVSAATLSSITITPVDQSIAKGTTLQLTAIGTFNDSSTQDLTTFVSWSSDHNEFAQVSNTVGSQGLVTGTGQGGPVTITATSGGTSGRTTVTVSAATLSSIAITPADQSIAKGTTLQLTATGTFSDTNTQDLTTLASWSSNLSGTAPVSNAVGTQGLVTGVVEGGPATVTATVGTVSGNTTVTVTALTLDFIEVLPHDPTISKGTTIPLTAIAHYVGGSTQDITASVTWTSSNRQVAHVVSSHSHTNGRLKANKSGTAIITATLGSQSGTTTVTVP